MLDFNLIEWPPSAVGSTLRKIFKRYAFTTIVCETNSVEETVTLAESFAAVLKIDNRPSGKQYKRLHIGLIGRPGNGKTPFSSGLVNAYGDFVIESQEDVYHQFKGDSPSFGSVSRADIMYGTQHLNSAPYYNGRGDGKTRQMGLGVDLIEHAEKEYGQFHSVIRVLHLEGMSENERHIRILCEAGLAKTEGFQIFLEGAQKFRRD